MVSATHGMTLAQFPAFHESSHDIDSGNGALVNNLKGLAMIAKIVLLMATLSFAAIPLSGCNTVQGAGKDVEKAGAKVQDEAAEHKKY